MKRVLVLMIGRPIGDIERRTLADVYKADRRLTFEAGSTIAETKRAVDAGRPVTPTQLYYVPADTDFDRSNVNHDARLAESEIQRLGLCEYLKVAIAPSTIKAAPEYITDAMPEPAARLYPNPHRGRAL